MLAICSELPEFLGLQYGPYNAGNESQNPKTHFLVKWTFILCKTEKYLRKITARLFACYMLGTNIQKSVH
jgi:hypothetical protein